MILFISDVNLKGSGYKEIAIESCLQLVKHGYEVKLLGIDYRATPHYYPFSILPVNPGQTFQHLQAMIQNFQYLAQQEAVSPIEALIFAHDVPQQTRLMRLPRFGVPYLGIFPVESGPLTPTWAQMLAPMDARLLISRFGKRSVEYAGLSAVHYPVGINLEAWKRPSPEERAELRKKMGYREDQMVVLTVAANQERKNLSAGAHMIQQVKASGIDVHWIMVTHIQSPVGWKLGDPPFDLGANLVTFERGLPHERLWTLYVIADAFLLPSKAEGLCMPILEAMAVGTPVVATDCSAVTEHLWPEPGEPGEERLPDQVWGDPRERDPQTLRGFPIAPAYRHQDPWGNSWRYYASPDSGADQLMKIWQWRQRESDLLEALIERGLEYVRTRTWDRAGDVLAETVAQVIEQDVDRPQAHPPPQVGTPAPIINQPKEVPDGEAQARQ